MRSFLIIFGGLIPLLGFGNVFSFQKRPYDFRLEVSKNRVVYRSHNFSHNETINDCERPFAEALNLDFLNFAKNDPKGTEVYVVDGKKFNVAKNSQLARELATVDIKLRTFAMEIRKKCSR